MNDVLEFSHTSYLSVLNKVLNQPNQTAFLLNILSPWTPGSRIPHVDCRYSVRRQKCKGYIHSNRETDTGINIDMDINADMYTTSIEVRFRDIDSFGHVNNAVYATYLEQARTDYFREVFGVGLTEIETVIAALEVEFKQPIRLKQSIEVYIAPPEVGESSLRMEYELKDGETVAATASTVQVMYDLDADRPVSVPSEWREAISQYHQT